MTAYHQPKEAPDPGDPPMQSQEPDRVAAFLQGTVSAGASSQDVAEAVAATFQAVEEVLAPIIGQRGAAALYKRALHLSGQTHAWLPVSPDGVPTAIDLAALTTALAKQTAAAAAAAGTQLLQTFHELLTSLIGPSLTERLLRSVWATFLSGPSAQDTTT